MADLFRTPPEPRTDRDGLRCNCYDLNIIGASHSGSCIRYAPGQNVTVEPTTYRVSCLADTDTDTEPDWDLWAITVELRSHGRWSVRHNTKSLGTDGTWSYGPLHDEDATEWVKAHRFTLDEALQVAREHAPKVTVNGLTAADVLARGVTS